MRISDWSSDVCSSDLWEAQCSGELGRIGIDYLSGQHQRSAKQRGGVYTDIAQEAARDHRQHGCVAPDGRRLDIVKKRPALIGEVLRSEEHKSELQSLMRISYAVFCLKKKNKIRN